eukprot:TRINITY_DN103639_c0_g1_i1.p1 TRINITY_DN103639_c0_g1~~TRINITY_DN103639_c0_g1_i1.p1  ORF type:complete len:493 (-),score=146.02 TRINITY_DN103639_c0_g1_i1:112-1590(-)
MGQALNHVWTSGDPGLHPELQRLASWTREDLLWACDQFKNQPMLAINLGAFWRFFKFDSREEAEAAFLRVKFKKNDKVDFMSIMSVMVIMSQQTFISRVTFLFSLCDFNSSGGISRAELGIGLRTLVNGIGKCFANASVPSFAEVEQIANGIMDELDADHSGIVELGEVVSYSYRSKGLLLLLSPFPSRDERIFEELIMFQGVSKENDLKQDAMLDKENKKLAKRLKICPDPRVERRSYPEGAAPKKKKWNKRPRHLAKLMTRMHGMVIYRVFNRLCGVGGTIERAELLDAVLSRRITSIAQQSIDLLSEVNPDPNLGRIMMHVQKHLSDGKMADRIKALDAEAISLRSFCVLTFPEVKVQEIEAALSWCRLFRAQEVLEELLKREQGSEVIMGYDKESAVKIDHIDDQDLDDLFLALDLDGDGELSEAELVIEAGLSEAEARKLMKFWDRGHDGTLSKHDVKGIVFGMDAVVRRKLKGLAAASFHSGVATI